MTNTQLQAYFDSKTTGIAAVTTASTDAEITTYVNAIFQAVLGRDPADQGLANISAAIKAGTFTELSFVNVALTADVSDAKFNYLTVAEVATVTAAQTAAIADSVTVLDAIAVTNGFADAAAEEAAEVAETANAATAATALTAYNTAVVTAATSKAAADTAALTVSTVALATASKTAADVAKVDADAVVTAATALKTATIATTATTDDAAADAAVTSSAAAQTAAANAVSTAATAIVGATAANASSLTINIDTYAGTSSNDTIYGNESIATDGTKLETFTALDTVDGGLGSDTLTITSTTADLDLTANAAGVTITSIETANLKAAGTVEANTTTWTGLTALNVASIGGTTGTITAATTTDVSVNDAAVGAVVVDGGKNISITTAQIATGGTIVVGGTTVNSGTVSVTSNSATTATSISAGITVTGGTTVVVNQNLTDQAIAANDHTSGTTDIVATTSTTSVTVNQTAAQIAAAATATTAAKSDIINGVVTIDDATETAGTQATVAGTLTSVSLANYDDSTIDSNALATLSLSGTAGTLTIDTGLNTAVNNALTLNLATLSTTANSTTASDNTITIANSGTGEDYKTINIVTSTAASTVTELIAADTTALNVSGDQVVTFTNVLDSLGTLASASVSGSAGISGDLAEGALRTFDASATSGNNTIVLDGTLTAAAGVTALSVKGGSGNDSVTTEGVLADDAVITLGAGTDTYVFDTGAALVGASVDAGADNDTIAATNGAWIDAAAASVYSNFETLEIAGGTGTYEMDILGLTAVTVTTTTTAGATVINDAAAGTTVDFNKTVTGSANVADAAILNTGITYNLKADTTADRADFGFTVNDTDALLAVNDGLDQTANGTMTAALITADAIETIYLSSNATTASIDSAVGANDAVTAKDYVNTITSLDGDAATSIVITGNAGLDVTTAAAMVALTEVDASASTGALVLTLTAAVAGVTTLGSAGADTIAGSTLGDLIQGNASADAITLGTAGAVDTVKYTAATDSVLTLTDTTSPVVNPVVMDTATGFDTVNVFVAGEDKIELAASLSIATGDARTAITDLGTTVTAGANTNAIIAAALQTVIGDGVDLFNDGTADRAIATYSFEDSTTAVGGAADATDQQFIFVDVNGDGNFVAADDMVINLNGYSTALAITDFTIA